MSQFINVWYPLIGLGIFVLGLPVAAIMAREQVQEEGSGVANRLLLTVLGGLLSFLLAMVWPGAVLIGLFYFAAPWGYDKVRYRTEAWVKRRQERKTRAAETDEQRYRRMAAEQHRAADEARHSPWLAKAQRDLAEHYERLADLYAGVS